MKKLSLVAASVFLIASSFSAYSDDTAQQTDQPRDSGQQASQPADSGQQAGQAGASGAAAPAPAPDPKMSGGTEKPHEENKAN